MPKIEQTLTSMEVAEMIGREHNALLKTIRTFVSHMEKIAENNNALGEENAEGENAHGSKDKYFKESTYEDANGQSRPCFNVTKKGCEFIAHKMKGIKGTEFTMRYIDRFHDMEETIVAPKLPQNTMELLELHYKALKEVDGKVDTVSEEVQSVKKELKEFKETLPLLPEDADEISYLVKKRGVEILGGKQSSAYNDKCLRMKLYVNFYSNLKYNFNVRTYKAIKRNQKTQALQIIEKYEPPFFLAQQIESVNAQQTLDLKGGSLR